MLRPRSGTVHREPQALRRETLTDGHGSADDKLVRRRHGKRSAARLQQHARHFWRCMPCVAYHETHLCVGGVAGGCNTGPQRSISRIKHDLHRRNAQSAHPPAKSACGSRAQRLSRRAHVPMTGRAGLGRYHAERRVPAAYRRGCSGSPGCEHYADWSRPAGLGVDISKKARFT